MARSSLIAASLSNVKTWAGVGGDLEFEDEIREGGQHWWSVKYKT